jgi:pimeloyl-ACP methyl ester carboxylesterase
VLRRLLTIIAALSMMLSTGSSAPASAVPDTVVLLHGLGLGKWSLWRVERALTRDGYHVVNFGYPSTRVPLETLAGEWLPAQLAARGIAPASTPRLHFVTHSMGGIVVRAWIAGGHAPANLSRVVMFAPPHQGTPLVDRIGGWWLFRAATGVNGRRLGTQATDAFPAKLGPWTSSAQLGVIAGDHTLNPLFSAWIPGPDDGKVPVAATRLDGMTDHCVLPYSHTWLQYRREPIAQVRAFLRTGRFEAR